MIVQEMKSSISHIHSLPDKETLYRALLEKDPAYEGIYYVGVKTTGIFCRLTCTARKPKIENTEFYTTIADALSYGFRPCKVCDPLIIKGSFPEWLQPLMKEIAQNPTIRLKDVDIKTRNLDPARIRRWFKKNYGITFQAYLRSQRISHALGQLKEGKPVTSSAFGSGYESLSGFTDTFKKVYGFPPSGSVKQKTATVSRINTPLGPMIAGINDKGLCLLEFTDRKILEDQIMKLSKALNTGFYPGDHPLLDKIEKQILEYFSGNRTEFDIPLDFPGSPFQVKVWQTLLKIPYGSTRSYMDQAKEIGNPKAIRAVAAANGQNRIAIVIPCHRIIGSDGSLTGYGGGIWRKKYLLDLENPAPTLFD